MKSKNYYLTRAAMMLLFALLSSVGAWAQDDLKIIVGATNGTPTIIGDINADGEVDGEDVDEIVKFIMQDPQATTDMSKVDINRDNFVNAADIVALTNVINSDTEIVYVSGEGETFAFQVETSKAYNVATTAAWITIDPEAKDGQHYVTVGMNPSTEQRMGIVTVTSTDGTLSNSLTVVQAGKGDSRYIAIDWEKDHLDSFDPETGVAVITFAKEVPVMGEYDIVMVPDELGTLMIRIIEKVTEVVGKTATLETTQGDMGNLFRDQKLTFELGDDGAASTRGVSGSKPVFRPEKVEIFEDGKYVEVYNANVANTRGTRAPSTQELTLNYEGSDVMLESWGNLTFKIQKAKLAMKFKGTLEFSFERQPWYKVWKGHTTKASVLLEGDSEGETVLDISCKTPDEMSGNAILRPDDLMRLKTGVVQQRYTFNVAGVPVQVVLNGDVGCTHGYQCLGLGDAVGGHKYSKHFKYGLTCVDDNLDGEFIFEEKPTLSLIYPEANIGSAEYKTSQCYGRASVLPVFKINFYGKYCRTDICPAEWSYVHPRSWLPYPDEAPDAIARRIRVDRWANTYIAMKNIPGWLLDHSEGDNFSSDDEKTEILMYNPEDFTLETPSRDLMQDDEQDIEITAFHYDHSTNEKLTSIGAMVAFEIEGSASGDKKLLLKYTDENGKAKVTFKKGEPSVERVDIKLFRTPIKDKDIEKYVEKKWTSKLLKYSIQCLNPSQEVEKGAEAVPVHFLLQKTEGNEISAWAHKRVEFVATNGTVTPQFNTTDANGLVTAYFTPTNSAPEGEVLAVVTEDGVKKDWEGRATGKITIKSSGGGGGEGPGGGGEIKDEGLKKADKLDDNTYVLNNKKTGETETRSYDPKYSEWSKSKDGVSVMLEDADENGGTQGMVNAFLPLTLIEQIIVLTGATFENTPGIKFILEKIQNGQVWGEFMKLSGEEASGNIKPDGNSKILLRKRLNPAPARALTRGDGNEEEYTGEYEILFYLVFQNQTWNNETHQMDLGDEYEVYGKGTMKMHIPTITNFQLSTKEDYVKVGNSVVVDVTGYYEEEATWDWNDVEMVGNAYSYDEVDNGVDGGFFSWDPATHSLTSLKSAGKEESVTVKFALKSKPSVKAYINLNTHEGWKYTSFKVGPEEQEVSVGSGGCSFYISSEFTPKDSEDEKFDATAIEIDPESDPDDNFRYYDWNNQYSPRLDVYRSDAAPGEYTLRFRLKSDHSIGCTMKITIKSED